MSHKGVTTCDEGLQAVNLHSKIQGVTLSCLQEKSWTHLPESTFDDSHSWNLRFEKCSSSTIPLSIFVLFPKIVHKTHAVDGSEVLH